MPTFDQLYSYYQGCSEDGREGWSNASFTESLPASRLRTAPSRQRRLPCAEFTGAQTQFDTTTDMWELGISRLGGEWVTRYLERLNSDTLSTVTNITYDTLKEWVVFGMNKYGTSL
ncbi:hypothetical protein FP744_10003150 [Trichoderma asperellum]